VSRGIGNPGNSFADLDVQGDTVNALLRSALHGTRGSTGDAMPDTDPLVMEIDQGEQDAWKPTEEKEEEDEFF
jgi:hypothetical protein